MSSASPSNSGTSDYEDEDAEEPRPNRWTGAPSTWHTLTEAERGLAASLATLRNQDLSMHLFNAHALKRRARETEFKTGANGSAGKAFRPPKTWTAWPLPPEDVPRTGEQIGPKSEGDGYTFRRGDDGVPSRELEDVLRGLTLKFAKERFNSRESAGPEDVYQDEGKNTARDDDRESTGSEYEPEDADGEENAVKAESQPPRQDQFKPTVSADDERSRLLLQPSIRHTLSKLDDILLALHHARATCHKYTASEAGTTDEEAEPSSPTKNPPGRPRNFANLPSRAKSGEGTVFEPVKHDIADLLRTKTTNLGRPKKVYERLPGEGQEEYLIRIARIQKKPLPSFAPPSEPHVSKSPSPRRGRSRSRSVMATSEERRVNRGRKLGVRDWSEVLGVAGLVGVGEKVLGRAARRCADLFGEGMVVKRLEETKFGEGGGEEVVRYVPELVPSLDDEEISSSASGSESQENIKSSKRKISSVAQRNVFCSIAGCSRKGRGFVDVAAMKRHLENGHGIAKDEVEDYILPSDEEMEGAVHVDGFLRPVKRLGGRRGRYKKKRSRSEEEIASIDGVGEASE